MINRTRSTVPTGIGCTIKEKQCSELGVPTMLTTGRCTSQCVSYEKLNEIRHACCAVNALPTSGFVTLYCKPPKQTWTTTARNSSPDSVLTTTSNWVTVWPSQTMVKVRFRVTGGPPVNGIRTQCQWVNPTINFIAGTYFPLQMSSLTKIQQPFA